MIICRLSFSPFYATNMQLCFCGSHRVLRNLKLGFVTFGTGRYAWFVSFVALKTFIGIEVTGVNVVELMAFEFNRLAFGRFGMTTNAGLF